MRPNDAIRFARAIGALGETYRQPVTAVTISAYEMGLDDLSIGVIEKAIKRALREKKFFPTVAELRELAGDLSPADRCVVAWDAVKRAHRSHGFYGSVDFDDKAINAAVRSLGGWEVFDERLEAEGEVWVRKEFDRIYQAYFRRGVTPIEGASLPGYHARNNALHGHREHIPRPALIRTSLTPVPLLGPPASDRPAIASDVVGLLEHVGKPTEKSK